MLALLKQCSPYKLLVNVHFLLKLQRLFAATFLNVNLKPKGFLIAKWQHGKVIDSITFFHLFESQLTRVT